MRLDAAQLTRIAATWLAIGCTVLTAAGTILWVDSHLDDRILKRHFSWSTETEGDYFSWFTFERKPYRNSTRIRANDGWLTITRKVHTRYAEGRPGKRHVAYGTEYTRYERRARTRWFLLPRAVTVTTFSFRLIYVLPVLSPFPLTLFGARGIRAIRMKRRLVAGQCVMCGYDLRALPMPRCPECGMVFCLHSNNR